MGKLGQMKTIEERFWSKVRKTDTCWLWIASTNGKGYGKIRRCDAMVYAHRLSWELHNGPIPEGFDVLHECDVRPCINPKHLFLGTQLDNAADMMAKRRGAYVTHPGTSNGRAKLTAAQVLEIHSRRGQVLRSLACEFGVHFSQIGRVRSGKSWMHLKETA